MTLDEYQLAALRTCSHAWGAAESKGLVNNGLGIAGEAGEVADYIKKVIGHHHPLDREKMAKELGDVLWYVAALGNDIGVTLEEIATKNIDKLLARYPNGFTTADSLARRDADGAGRE